MPEPHFPILQLLHPIVWVLQQFPTNRIEGIVGFQDAFHTSS